MTELRRKPFLRDARALTITFAALLVIAGVSYIVVDFCLPAINAERARRLLHEALLRADDLPSVAEARHRLETLEERYGAGDSLGSGSLLECHAGAESYYRRLRLVEALRLLSADERALIERYQPRVRRLVAEAEAR